MGRSEPAAGPQLVPSRAACCSPERAVSDVLQPGVLTRRPTPLNPLYTHAPHNQQEGAMGPPLGADGGGASIETLRFLHAQVQVSLFESV